MCWAREPKAWARAPRPPGARTRHSHERRRARGSATRWTKEALMGVLDLVGCGRPVDAPVGHPAGRQPGRRSARAASGRGAAVAAGGLFEDLLQVEVLVELLELPFGRLRERLPESVGERARRR